MINPAQLRRQALEKQRQEHGGQQVSNPLACPDCGTLGMHNCPYGKAEATTFAEMSYDWKSHGR